MADPCYSCGDRGTVGRSGKRVPCPACSPEMLAARERSRMLREADRAAQKMIRIANGRAPDLEPLREAPMPDGELGGPAEDGCCSEARYRACVCFRSTWCPEHGTICRGTHD